MLDSSHDSSSDRPSLRRDDIGHRNSHRFATTTHWAVRDLGRSAKNGITAVSNHALALAWPADWAQRMGVLGLLAVDLALTAAFVAFAYAEHYGIRTSPFYGNVKFSFVDGGYPELFGYGKQLLIALLLHRAHSATRQAVYQALALLFVVVALDDALALHETLGGWLGAATGMSARAGELLSWAAIGLIPLAAVAISLRHSDSRSRADAYAVLAGFALLIFFAAGMDVVHGILQKYVTGFQTVLTLAEDGGELIALTLICALALGIFRGTHPSAASRTNR